MNFVNDYALLVAVAIPVVMVLGAQVALFLGGERGTLLLPGFNHYPSHERAWRLDFAPSRIRAMPAANDENARLSA